jgi:MEMO1 family protein
MDLRPSPIAGQWYSGHAPSLARSVDAYLEAAKAEVHTPAGEIVGVIAPHAGHKYSGPVAAYAFEAVRGLKVDTVTIMCPSHFHDDGLLITSSHEAYATPLGTVPVDQEALELLRADLAAALSVPGDFALAAIRHDHEHAIEIELPFLQRVLAEGFNLIPVMLRDQSPRVARALGLALAKVLRGRRALLVGSSDLSHYYPQPIAQQLDAEMLKQIGAFDPDGVLVTEAEGRGFACGHGAIAAALWAARELGANHAQVLKHATSGDTSGDYAQVVGYGAAVIWKE